MKIKGFNKLYRRMIGLVTVIFALLIVLFLILLFLVFRTSIFNVNINISNHTFLIVICSIISLLLVSQGMAIFWSRRITKPIAQISEAVDNIAQGNFDSKIEVKGFKHEIKVLAENINKMAEELRSIEVMRSDFVSNVSHEFKAPLATIQGYATLLSDDNISEEKAREYLKLLTESTAQLSGLVDNVLKLSRIESQNIMAKPEKFSLDEQLRRVVLMYEQQWSEKDLYLDLDLPLCECVGQKDLLNQMWINLVGNAVKFTENGGKIGIKLSDNGDAVKVVVSDDGIGMSEEVKKHIFEKFYQGDESRKSQGNGLGLALVKTIADLTGCTISVESELNKGTSFSVTVPKA